MEEGTFLIKERDVIDIMAKKGVFLVPTLAAKELSPEDLEHLPDFCVRKSMEAQVYAAVSNKEKITRHNEKIPL
jgi:hypothetical protein